MSIGEYLSIGGPPAVVLGILGFLLNAYLSKRKDDREETRLDRESESGIVETTRTTLQLVRAELKEITEARARDKQEHAKDLAELKAEHAAEMSEVRAELREVKRQNREMAKELAEWRRTR